MLHHYLFNSSRVITYLNKQMFKHARADNRLSYFQNARYFFYITSSYLITSVVSYTPLPPTRCMMWLTKATHCVGVLGLFTVVFCYLLLILQATGRFNDVVSRRWVLTGTGTFWRNGRVIHVALIFCNFLCLALCLAETKECSYKKPCEHTFSVPTQHSHAAHAINSDLLNFSVLLRPSLNPCCLLSNTYN